MSNLVLFYDCFILHQYVLGWQKKLITICFCIDIHPLLCLFLLFVPLEILSPEMICKLRYCSVMCLVYSNSMPYSFVVLLSNCRAIVDFLVHIFLVMYVEHMEEISSAGV